MDGSIGTPPVMRSREYGGSLDINDTSRDLSAINRHEESITNSAGGIRKRLGNINRVAS